MRLTREDMILIVKRFVNKSFISKNNEKLYYNRISIESRIPYFKYLNRITLNKRFYADKLSSAEKYALSQNFSEFYRVYTRFKTQHVSNILSKYEHYILTFKGFYSNFYIMLTDNFGNPIVSCSTGQVSQSRSKKQKNSMMLVYPMMQKVKSAMAQRNARHLVVHIRMDITSKVVIAMKYLNFSKLHFKVTYIALLKPMPHHFGMRKRKPRRV